MYEKEENDEIKEIDEKEKYRRIFILDLIESILDLIFTILQR